MRIHAAPVFAPARTQENTPGELLMYWFCARGYFLEIREETKRLLCKRVVLANVPSFGFFLYRSFRIFQRTKDTVRVSFQECLSTGSSKVTSCGYWQKRVRLSDLLDGDLTVLQEPTLTALSVLPNFVPSFRQVPGRTRGMCSPSCELWRSLAKIGKTHNSISTRTSLTFTRMPGKVPSVCGWPSECVQLVPVFGTVVPFFRHEKRTQT